MSLVVTVDFLLVPGAEHDFMPLITENAVASMRNEPGCRRFDVACSTDGAHVFLYEVYDDKDAFSAHLESAHYLAFDAATTAMVREKRVKHFRLAVSPA